MATDFLKAIRAEEEEFDYALPDLLKEAEKKQPKNPVLPILKIEGDGLGGTNVRLYYLINGRVWDYFQIIKRGHVTPYHGPHYGQKPFKKLTYKAFVKSLSIEDKISLAENLRKLGL